MGVGRPGLWAVRVGSCLLFGGALALVGCIWKRVQVLVLVLFLALLSPLQSPSPSVQQRPQRRQQPQPRQTLTLALTPEPPFEAVISTMISRLSPLSLLARFRDPDSDLSL